MTVWQLASLPFWILAAGFLAGTIVGFVGLHWRIDRVTNIEFRHALIGFAAFLLAAGIFALLAAKIAS